MALFSSSLAKPVLVSSALLCFTLFYRQLKHGRRPPLPPGPKGLPIVGNVLQMPKTLDLWNTAIEWGKTYGDMVYLELLGMPLLFVNNYDIAVDLLDKRSATYSSRPLMVMMNELQRWEFMTVNMPYGERHRRHRLHYRRFFQTSEAVVDYLDVQLRGARVMLDALLRTPEEYGQHVKRLVGSVILRNVYGLEDSPKNDKYFAMGEASMRTGEQARHFMFLDAMPWLKYLPEWFPGATFHRVAKTVWDLAHAMHYDAHEETKKKIREGTAHQSMTSVLLEDQTDADGHIEPDVEEDISAVAATAFAGGSDTSVTAVMTFILAMLKNPEIQRRGQEELDRVIGKDRLPTFEDRENLPYVRAICSETLRWETITPLTPPHCTTADDVYNGYFIPSGTTVLVNVWAISRDPKMYPDPLEFKPERWLTSDKASGPLRSEKYSFGFGRRICPGQDWAESIIFIAVASLLAAFKIEQATGPDGKPIPPNDNFDQDIVRHLPQSICKFTPRSSKIPAVIRQAVDSSGSSA